MQQRPQVDPVARQIAVLSSLLNINSNVQCGTIPQTQQESLGPPPPAVFSYKVKIINPNKKSDVIVRQLNRFKSKFSSPLDIRLKIIEECSQHVPSTTDYNVGYFDQQAKVLLVTNDDVETMYQNCSTRSITLWCDGNQVQKTSGSTGKKRKYDSVSEYREDKENEVDTVLEELQEIHEDGQYDMPRLRLWSRMIATGIHNDYHNPPNIPALTGNSSKRARQAKSDNLSEALSSAAVAVVDAIKGKEPKDNVYGTTSSVSTKPLSPDMAVDIRMKNYEQLRYLQSLLHDGILSDCEYTEQKESILTSLRKLKDNQS